MVFSKDDLAIIITCFTEKGWTGTRIAKEFPNKKCNNWSINRVLAKYRHTRTTDRKKGSGRPMTAMTDENLAEVEQLCQSQDDKPGTHNSQCQAAHIIGVSRRPVQRMLKRRRLHPFKRMWTSAMNANARHSRKTRSQVLYRRFSVATVKKIIFTDEKDFTLEVPTNRQNDRVYAKGRKSDVCPNRLYTTEIGFRRSWWLAQVCHGMEKQRSFSSTHRILKSTRRLTLTFWRRPCCQNAAVCIQTMISSSCKTALHHTTPKQLKIFFETTRPISSAHKNGHRICQIWIY